MGQSVPEQFVNAHEETEMRVATLQSFSVPVRVALARRATSTVASKDLPRGRILVLGGPSSVGKSTLQRLLCQNKVDAPFRFRPLLTCTTRAPRPGETQGVDYNFMTPDAYDAAGNDMEERTVYNGVRYGTLRSDLDAAANAQGVITVAALDAVGLAFLRARCGRAGGDVRGIFLKASLATLRARLLARGSDAPTLEKRLALAASTELTPAYEALFDAAVVNDDGVDVAVAQGAVEAACAAWWPGSSGSSGR